MNKMNGQLKVLATNTNCGTDGIQEDVVRVAACLPHSKPSEALVFDVITFGSYRKRYINYYPPNRKIDKIGVPNDAASSYATITCDPGLYTKG